MRAGAATPEIIDFAYPIFEAGPATGAVATAYAEGVRLTQSDQLPEAMVVFGQVVAKAPRHAGALHMLGLCCWLAGNPREANLYLVQAARGTNVAPQTLMALAALAAQGGGAPETVGWMKKAFRQMSLAEQRAWAGKDYFRNVRTSEVFQNMIADLPPAALPAEDASTEGTGSPPRQDIR
jgi:thioredoxin-like negative regulator of GroEL